MKKLPDFYLNKMKKLLKDDFDDYLKSFDKPKVQSIRINTSKIAVKDFLKINPFNLEKIPWTTDGFYFEDEKVSKHPYYYAGLYYIQEASAMLPAETLEINQNDRVLDACAAPGGKSLKSANKLNNSGLLFSNDISVSRAQILLKTLENGGIANAIIMAEDIKNLDRFQNYFDKILIDAPCSGEGMFRKDDNLLKFYDESTNEKYAAIQKEIIAKAINLLKPGGKLVYSTCTFDIRENEEVIEYALNYDSSLKVLDINKTDLMEDGLTTNTKGCARLYPHKIKGEGHFVAYLQKEGTLTTNKTINPNEAFNFLKDFNLKLNNGTYLQRNDKYYFEPYSNINLKGLRILRSGLYLGEYKHDKFDPSISLALYLKDEYKNIINFKEDDIRVIKYLKCETLDVKDFNVKGLTLIKVNNYPLGFGVVKNGILKNKYPLNYSYK